MRLVTSSSIQWTSPRGSIARNSVRACPPRSRISESSSRTRSISSLWIIARLFTPTSSPGLAPSNAVEAGLAQRIVPSASKNMVASVDHARIARWRASADRNWRSVSACSAAPGSVSSATRRRTRPAGRSRSARDATSSRPRREIRRRGIPPSGPALTLVHAREHRRDVDGLRGRDEQIEDRPAFHRPGSPPVETGRGVVPDDDATSRP